MANEKRLIYVDEVIRAMQTVMSEEPNQNSLGCRVFAEIIKGLELTPTVDAVEVVRCKDCKKYRTDACAMSYMDRDEDMAHCWAKATDFCSRGERR